MTSSAARNSATISPVQLGSLDQVAGQPVPQRADSSASRGTAPALRTMVWPGRKPAVRACLAVVRPMPGQSALAAG
ncbi:MAG: hypothetical protein ACK5MT_08525 [Actinomycetales bacterium]